MRKLVLLLIIILGLAGTLFAMPGERGQRGQKQDACDHRGRMGDNDMEHGFLADLNLTPEQETKIDNLMITHHKEMIDLKAALEKLHIEKQEALKKEDYKTANKIIDQLATKRAEMQKKGLALRESIMKELTPEQKEKALSFKPRMGRNRQMDGCENEDMPMPARHHSPNK